MNSSAVTRIGVLVPAGNTVHEAEFARLRPAGVEFAFRGFAYPSADSADFCGDLAQRMAAPMAELRDWGAVLMLIGCTTASMKCCEPAQEARFAALAGVPVVTAAAASREAFAALQLRSLAVATPYGDSGNATVAQFLRADGMTVAAIAGLGLDRSPEVWKTEAVTLPARRVADFAAATDVPAADAMYLPCTGVGSIEAIDLFEQQQRKPAVSSVQAGYWACLRRLGIEGRRDFGGHLIRSWP
jgi:maleate cis-trans isomerase